MNSYYYRQTSAHSLPMKELIRVGDEASGCLFFRPIFGERRLGVFVSPQVASAWDSSLRKGDVYTFSD